MKEDEVLDALLESIEKHDYLHKVVLGVQSPEAVKKVKAYDSTIKVLASCRTWKASPLSVKRRRTLSD